MTEFSWKTRRQSLSRLSEETFDLLIIGGGITGAGLALDGSLRGLKVGLVEKRDFASGTSSRSTKLIHGGLRYLEHLDFRLVREGLSERSILTRVAPHLAEPFPFVIPIYSNSSRNYDHPLKMRAGLFLYDLLAGRYGLGRHRRLSPGEALELAPQLDPNGLKGAFLYYDGVTDDSRLVIEVIKAAHERGACVANYTRLTRFLKDEGGNLCGAGLLDQAAGVEFETRARILINATGVWMEETLRLEGRNEGSLLKSVRPSKGVHLTVSAARLKVDAAWLIPSLGGHRFYFVVPWEGRVNIGTTDTDYDDDRDSPSALAGEIDEILGTINAYFPSAQLEPSDVISSWAGLRPLISDPNVTSTADISRKEEIIEAEDGLISLAGGKLTTYRLMAERGIDLAMKRLGERDNDRAGTAEVPISGGEKSREELSRIAVEISKTENLPLETSRHLVFSYGSDYPRLIELMREDERLRRPLVEGLPHVAAEVAYAVRSEMALNLADVLTRRTRLAMLAGEDSINCAAAVADLMAEVLGWNQGETEVQIDQFKREFEREYARPRK